MEAFLRHGHRPEVKFVLVNSCTLGQFDWIFVSVVCLPFWIGKIDRIERYVWFLLGLAVTYSPTP